MTGLAMAGWWAATLSAGRPAQSAPMMMHDDMSHMGASMMTREQKIEMASSAAPASIAAGATILDWPAKDGEPPTVLRAGSNGWSCFPDMPETRGSDPMCLDKTWMTWADAYMAHTPPHVTSVGIGYMIAPGGAWASNTDPYATMASPGNQWALHQPHLMILVPNLESLAGLPTDPGNGGPYVMYAGTPYAHIMAPVASLATDSAMDMKTHMNMDTGMDPTMNMNTNTGMAR